MRGNNPMMNAISTSGVAATSSRPFMSERLAFSLCLMGPKKTFCTIANM